MQRLFSSIIHQVRTVQCNNTTRIWPILLPIRVGVPFPPQLGESRRATYADFGGPSPGERKREKPFKCIDLDWPSSGVACKVRRRTGPAPAHYRCTVGAGAVTIVIVMHSSLGGIFCSSVFVVKKRMGRRSPPLRKIR